jgi:hypothetical protein
MKRIEKQIYFNLPGGTMALIVKKNAELELKFAIL